MQVRFWGTRGSIASPGATTCHFGGNTACVSVTTAAGDWIILDCGTGARPLGVQMLAELPQPIHASILLTHTHWDHIQGFPFFAPVFVPGSRFDVYAPEGGLRSLEETLAGQMEYTYFPVDLGQLPSLITYHELSEGCLSIGDARVEAQYLNHPAMTLGYRIDCDGVVVAYLSDHEPFAQERWRTSAPRGTLASILHEGDRRHARFMATADLVIHDAQYTPAEYPAKLNWGHSSFDYAVELAAASGVRRLALTHHDPTRRDEAIVAMEREAQALAASLNPNLEVFYGYEGCSVELGTAHTRRHPDVPRQDLNAQSPRPAYRVLLVAQDGDLGRAVQQALGRDPLRLSRVDDCTAALAAIQTERPHLLLLDVSAGAGVAPVTARILASAELPLLLLVDRDRSALERAGFDPTSADYLTTPFSIPQLRARVKARLARDANECATPATQETPTR